LSALAPAIEASLRQQFAASAGAFGSLIGIGARNISEGGAPVGNVLVIGLPGGVMSDAVYQVMVDGLATNTGVSLTTSTISGVEVSSGSGAAAAMSVFRRGDTVIVTLMPTDSKLTAVTTALVTANR
jgi:hypothetical protein